MKCSIEEERDRLQDEHSNQCETISKYQERVKELEEDRTVLAEGLDVAEQRERELEEALEGRATELEHLRAQERELERALGNKDANENDITENLRERVRELEAMTSPYRKDRVLNLETENRCLNTLKYEAEERVRELEEEIDGGWKRAAEIDRERVRELETRGYVAVVEENNELVSRVRRLEEERAESPDLRARVRELEKECKAYAAKFDAFCPPEEAVALRTRARELKEKNENWRDRYCKAQGELNELRRLLRKLPGIEE